MDLVYQCGPAKHIELIHQNNTIYASISDMYTLYQEEGGKIQGSSRIEINPCDVNYVIMHLRGKMLRVLDKDDSPYWIDVDYTTYYNLDIIIAVGYKVSAPLTTRHFKKWAKKRLRSLIYDYTGLKGEIESLNARLHNYTSKTGDLKGEMELLNTKLQKILISIP